MISRQYMIFSTTEIDTIEFNQVCETSPETLRKSLDESKTFVKWDSEEIPACVEALTTKEGPYNHTEILEILSGPEWTKPIDENEELLPAIVIGEVTEPTSTGEPV
jgi:hypothetical protein